MKLVFRYLRSVLGMVVLTLFFLLGQVFCELQLPNLMSNMVNIGIQNGGLKPGQVLAIGANPATVQRNYILLMGAKMLGIALIGALAAIAVNYLASRIATGTASRLRHDLFTHITSFSQSEMGKFSTASLITRDTNDVQQVQTLIFMGLKMMCFAPVMGAGALVMALGKSASLSRLIAVALVVLLAMISCVLYIAMPRFKSLQMLIDRLNLVSRENLSGMMVIRAFGGEKREEARFQKAAGDLCDTERFVNRTMAIMMPSMTLLMNLLSLTIVWVGASQIAQSTMQVGDIMAFIQYSMHVIMSFLVIAMMFVMVPRAMVSAARIEEVFSTKSSIDSPPQASTASARGGEVCFRKVSFRYAGAEEDVLQDISFVADAGKTTAIIGSTGSGKSTLLNLIPRFYDVSAGVVTLNGMDVRDFALGQLRDKIGYIPQKGLLFSGDIASNLRYGKEDATEEEMWAALETAQAKEFAESAEGKLSAPVAQGGDNVSGGQRQRLAIARALIKKPEIYLFDDSFSALDFKTDAALRRALPGYTNGATIMIVAQRVSTILYADRIVVLDHGKIAGMGTHRELLQNCAVYREIAESQLSQEELQ